MEGEYILTAIQYSVVFENCLQKGTNSMHCHNVIKVHLKAFVFSCHLMSYHLTHMN